MFASLTSFSGNSGAKFSKKIGFLPELGDELVVRFEALRFQNGAHSRRSQFVCRGLPGAAPRNRSLTTDDADNADMGSAERSGRYNFVPFVIFCQKWNRGLSPAAPQQPKICPPNTQRNPKVSEGGRDHRSRLRLAVWTTLRCNNVTISPITADMPA